MLSSCMAKGSHLRLDCASTLSVALHYEHVSQLLSLAVPRVVAPAPSPAAKKAKVKAPAPLAMAVRKVEVPAPKPAVGFSSAAVPVTLLALPIVHRQRAF